MYELRSGLPRYGNEHVPRDGRQAHGAQTFPPDDCVRRGLQILCRSHVNGCGTASVGMRSLRRNLRSVRQVLRADRRNARMRRCLPPVREKLSRDERLSGSCGVPWAGFRTVALRPRSRPGIAPVAHRSPRAQPTSKLALVGSTSPTDGTKSPRKTPGAELQEGKKPDRKAGLHRLPAGESRPA